MSVSDSLIAAAVEAAVPVYEENQCQTGCCGDFRGGVAAGVEAALRWLLIEGLPEQRMIDTHDLLRLADEIEAWLSKREVCD